jgi:2-polyprenyl-3-methyl-5-hydroxy-6-metoxy-1,4-benzoquinol methylase
LPDGYDVVVSSLFLHHLSDAEALGLLRRLRSAVRRGIVITDLNRHYAGYLLAYLGTRLLTRSPMAHYDGPLSVQAAFNVREVHDLARQAGLDGATIRRVLAMRYLLEWRRS